MEVFTKIIFAVAVIGSGFSGPLHASTQGSEKAISSGWFQNAPSVEGWRSVKWGISIEDLSKTYPNEIERLKKPKKVITPDPHFLSTFRATFKQKLLIDGRKYNVSFGFDDDNHLNYVELRCYYFTKGKGFDEAFKAAASTLIELFGEPDSKSEDTNRNGTYAFYIWEKSNVDIMLRFFHNNYRIGGIPISNDKHLIITGRFIGTG